MAPPGLRFPGAQGLEPATDVFKRRAEPRPAPVEQHRPPLTVAPPQHHVPGMKVSVNYRATEGLELQQPVPQGGQRPHDASGPAESAAEAPQRRLAPHLLETFERAPRRVLQLHLVVPLRDHCHSIAACVARVELRGQVQHALSCRLLAPRPCADGVQSLQVQNGLTRVGAIHMVEAGGELLGVSSDESLVDGRFPHTESLKPFRDHRAAALTTRRIHVLKRQPLDSRRLETPAQRRLRHLRGPGFGAVNASQDVVEYCELSSGCFHLT